MSDSKTTTYALKFPIQTESGETLTELIIRRLTVGDLIDLESGSKNQSDLTSATTMLAHASGIGFPDIKKMDLSDYTEASKILSQSSGISAVGNDLSA